MAKILIVDDEKDISSLVARFARLEDFETVEAASGEEAVELCKAQDFDIIVMDIMMDGMDGFASCKEIRKFKDIPVLFLSARGEEYDKLTGFDLGGDDYMVKPFSPKEVLARIKAILRRSGKTEPSQKSNGSEKIAAGKIQIDTAGRNVFVGGEKIALTAKEYDLLLLFVQNKGAVLSREQIIDAVWGQGYFCGDRTVDWQVKQLRKSLKSCRDCIVTYRGVGYKFESE